MSNTNQISRVAFLVSAAISLAACDSGGDVSGGGGAVEVASDSCLAVAITDAATSHSGNMANLVDSTEAGQFQYSIVQQPSNGTVTLNMSTGDYEFTPNATLAGARGFRTSFTYGVLDNNVQVDSGVVELIYGAKRIMPLGDSITFGVTFFDGTDNNPAPAFAIGYRKALYDLLDTAGYEVDFVGTQVAGTDASVALADTNHQGIPGVRADGLAASISTYLDNAATDIVLSHAGTNDLFQTLTTTQATTNVNGLVSNMQTWRNTQNDQPLTVLAAKIIPSYELAGNFSTLRLSTIEAFNTQMESDLNASFSSDQNLNVDIVDHYSALNPATDLTIKGTGGGQDRVGLHPNTSGYTKMANTWYDALIATGELEKCE